MSFWESLGFFFLISFFFLIYFIYFWLCWVFVSVRGLSLVVASGGHSSSWCVGLSLSRPLLLRSTSSRRAGSVVVAHGPSCSTGMWDLPGPGLESVSPALAGRFSTTVPPGKPSDFYNQIGLQNSLDWTKIWVGQGWKMWCFSTGSCFRTKCAAVRRKLALSVFCYGRDEIPHPGWRLW